MEDEKDFTSPPREDSILEREVVAEVVHLATELLVSRAGKDEDDEEELFNWLQILWKGGRYWLWEGKCRTASDKAYEVVETYLEMLQYAKDYEFLRGGTEVSVPEVSLSSQRMWAAELQCIEGMSLKEEERRETAARELEFMLLYDLEANSGWRMKVFGSSKSRFGSPDSDLYMCISTSLDDYFPPEVLGFYYLKRLIGQKVWDSDGGLKNNERAQQLKKARSQIIEAKKKFYKSKNQTQLQVDAFFDLQMQLLVKALDDELNQKRGSRFGGSMNSRHQEELLRVSKRRKNDLFDLKSMLECTSSCTIDSIASHARVPVPRFRFERIGVEYKCDLCFDNELGVRNTRLLAAYASFDDRARELGLAVKHWAKQRGIIDTSSGFLSSYSFVLLTIYYLQVVHVLPNLQDPDLLELAEVQPEFYDQESVAFCEDFEIAQNFHKATAPNSDYLDASLPALLFGFFKFFATQFDYVRQVVAIRSPDKSISKQSLWGAKSKTWRMSIQDPLQTTRDVGGVLHLSSQCKFTYELHRAYESFEDGDSFFDSVCPKQE